MKSVITHKGIAVFILCLFFCLCFAKSEGDQSLIYNEWSDNRPKVALVLSGGGARGIAQIGMLQEFEEAGIPIDYIVGTSMGAIIGGLYSVGYTANELDSIVTEANWDDILSLEREIERKDVFLEQKYVYDRSLLLLRFNNFNLKVPEGLVIGIRFQNFLQKLLWQGLYKPFGDFDKLKYKFRSVATEVVSGESVAFSKGNLVNSIIASATVPLRNSPIRIDSSIYLDGGLKANIPVVQARNSFSPDIIIAINTTSPLFSGDKLDKPWNLADQVLSIMMVDYSNDAKKKADILIEPSIKGITNTDFHKAKSLIEKGRTAARDMLPTIRNLIKQKHSGKSKPQDSSNVNINIAVDSVTLYAKNGLNIKIDSIEYMNQIPEKMKDDIWFVDSLFTNHFIFLNQNELSIYYEELLRVYQKHGYSFAHIKKTKYDNDKRKLYINIDIGEVRDIKISGNSTSDFIIYRELAFEVGDTLNTVMLSESWGNLSSVELFKNVEFDFYTYDNYCGVDVNIDVEEMGNQILSVGARVDNERFGQIGLDLIQMNIFNFGTRFNLRFTGGQRNQAISAAIEQTRVLNSMITAGIKSYYSNYGVYSYKRLTNNSKGEDIYEYDREGENIVETYGINASLGTQIEKKGLLSLQFRFDRQRYYDNDSDLLPSFYSINTMKIGTIFDSENEYDFPTSGRLIEIYLETTTLQTPDGVGFSKASFFYRENNSYGRHTFRRSFLFGYADETLPYPEFFSLGGQDNFYGLNENAEMGRQIIKGSLEYRLKTPFDILFDTYFSLRYDIGAAWVLPEDIKISKLKHGIGTSLSLDTPLGPAKFSIGKSFYFQKSPTSVIYAPLQVYFRLGMQL